MIVIRVHTHKYTPVQRPLSWRKSISATTCTKSVSLVAVAIPLITRAARMLVYEVARACQMHELMPIKQKRRLVKRRPKVFEHGTMIKFAKPRARTQAPVNKLSCVSLRWNSAANIGNIGPIERADSTETNRKRN